MPMYVPLLGTRLLSWDGNAAALDEIQRVIMEDDACFTVLIIKPCEDKSAIVSAFNNYDNEFDAEYHGL